MTSRRRSPSLTSPNPPKLLGIAGPAGCGKDTFASFLLHLLPVEWRRKALAGPIKETVNALYGWDDRHSNGELKEVADEALGFSPRQAYQLFGTEYGRALHPEHWIRVHALDNERTICTDVRFENEAEYIRKNGLLIHIVNSRAKPVASHSSEAGLQTDLRDIIIYNENSLQDLQQQAAILVDLCF